MNVQELLKKDKKDKFWIRLSEKMLEIGQNVNIYLNVEDDISGFNKYNPHSLLNVGYTDSKPDKNEILLYKANSYSPMLDFKYMYLQDYFGLNFLVYLIKKNKSNLYINYKSGDIQFRNELYNIKVFDVSCLCDDFSFSNIEDMLCVYDVQEKIFDKVIYELSSFFEEYVAEHLIIDIELELEDYNV